jgi:2,4-dienoyl-CoA reductase (NADPH2)
MIDSSQSVYGRDNFPNLFKPGLIGRFQLNNRVKYAACSVSNYNSYDGFVSPRELSRDEVIAQTGAAVLTNQGAYPDAVGEGKVYPRQLAIYDDRYISSMKQISTLWRKTARPGTLFLSQILHGGRYGGFDLDYCMQPSEVPQKIKKFKSPRQMTKDDIQRCIEDHAQAARRLVEAGFDGVEVTCFTGYLLANFNSKYTNQRTDEYGGSVENRARFMAELVQAIRKEIGDHLVVGVRLSGTEQLPGGNTDEECVEFMKIAESVGVDYISVVIAWHESDNGALGRHLPPDHWLYLLENIRQNVKGPLCYGPQLRDPFIAEKTLGEGLIDFWELCRPFLCDPDLLNKAARGHPEEIKPCIGDLMCISKFVQGQPYLCTCNPRLGHEADPEYNPLPIVRRKKVMVIGGGPAGIETALQLHRRGHDVAIFEKSDRLGGQLLSAGGDPKGGYQYLNLVDWYEDQVEKAGIDVHLNTNVTAETIFWRYWPYMPDVVVLAAGARIQVPDIPGAIGENVFNALDVLRNNVTPPGDRIVIIGGGKVGNPLALKLHELGKKVVIVEKNRRVHWDLAASYKFRNVAWLLEAAQERNELEMITSTVPLEISSHGVRVKGETGEERWIEVDSVILAVREANQDLLDMLTINADEQVIVGDAVRPRFLYTAIHEGYKAGCRI